MGELMPDIPISLSQVTADWLEQQFHDVGHDISGIIGFNHAPMEGFTGARVKSGSSPVNGKKAPTQPSGIFRGEMPAR